MVTILSRISCCSSRIVCRRFLCTHSLKYPHTNTSGNLRSGDRTGRGIPRTWKCFLSLINTLHTPQMHYHRTDFETAWYLLLLSVHTMPDHWAKRFWNLSVGFASSRRFELWFTVKNKRRCSDHIVYLQRDETGHWSYSLTFVLSFFVLYLTLLWVTDCGSQMLIWLVNR